MATAGQPIRLPDIAAGNGGYEIRGEAAGDGAGGSIAAIRDLNGDARPEVVVGALGNDAAGNGTGAAYVAWGKADGTALRLADVAAGQGGYRILGEAAGDQAGSRVAQIGDLNGDGRPEVLVGAGSNGGDHAGAAYVVWGKADGAQISLSQVAQGVGGYKITGPAPYALAGQGLGSAGDMNGDGLPEVLVGAPGSEGSGIYVAWGRRGGKLSLADVAAGQGGGFRILPESAGDEVGRAVASIGDLNGDGLPEILVGASRNDAGGGDAGAAYVVWGKGDGATVRLADVAAGQGGFRILGGAALELAGSGIAPVGDLNGDGKPEILVGAYGSTTPYAAYVVWGKGDGTPVRLADVATGQGGYGILQGALSDLGGFEVGSIGDIGGDGRPETLVSALYDSTVGAVSGSLYLGFGRGDGATVDLARIAAGGTGDGARILGRASNDFAGRSPGGIGDLDGDGREEVLLGSDSGAGAAYVVFSRELAAAAGQPAPAVDWNALAAQVQANFAATGQWFGGSGSPVVDPRQTDWDLVAGIVARNFEETGRWFL